MAKWFDGWMAAGRQVHPSSKSKIKGANFLVVPQYV
jgi:hypothetical protein